MGVLLDIQMKNVNNIFFLKKQNLVKNCSYNRHTFNIIYWLSNTKKNKMLN